MKAFPYLSMIYIAACGLSGCVTVKVPDVDFLKLPEFREIVKNNQTNVPDVSEIPDTPDNVRTDEDWDGDATKLIELREGFVVPDANVAVDLRTQEQIDAELALLKAKVQAYKLDDPQ
ncbi:MAG: hypothetical protein ABJG88_06865 [Litorimonas sp.]